MGDINMSMGLGVSVTTLDVGSASPVGLVFDLNMWNVHLDFASNMATGKGEYLEFSSTQTTKADKQVWYAINAGYNIEIKNSWYIVPKIGCIILRDIWEDPVAWDTYYEESAGTKAQFGAEIRKEINHVNLKVCSSTTEIFSAGIGYVF